MCLNAAAARSYLLRYVKRTDLILAGRTQAQTDGTIAAAIDKKELPAMEPRAMCYMLSKQGYGGDSVKHWPPHSHVFLFADRPRNLGSGSAGFSHPCYERHPGAPDYVRGCRATVVRRNGRSLRGIYTLGPAVADFFRARRL